jgi:hypothetical protein
MIPTHFPEPVHRIGTTSTASGISLRRIPLSSFDSIVETCNHYEQKCAGYYEPQTRASRYVYDLSNEVRKQVLDIKMHYEDETRRIERRANYFESVLSEWAECFGKGMNDDSLEIRPKDLLKRINDQTSRINQLTAELDTLRQQSAEHRDAVERRFHEQSTIARYRQDIAETEWKKQMRELADFYQKQIDQLKQQQETIVEERIRDRKAEMESMRERWQRELDQYRQDVLETKKIATMEVQKARADLNARATAAEKSRDQIVKQVLQRTEATQRAFLDKFEQHRRTMVDKVMESLADSVTDPKVYRSLLGPVMAFSENVQKLIEKIVQEAKTLPTGGNMLT